MRSGTAILASIAIALTSCTTSVRPSAAPAAESSPPAIQTETTPSPSLAPSATSTGAVIASPLPTVYLDASGPQASAVQFVDATHGWLGVEDGLLATSDAGLSWRRQLTSERITQIWPIDATHAWALAANETVYRTQDGEHWTTMPTTTPPIVAIDFVAPLIGWAIAVPPPASGATGPPVQRTGTLLGTIDGGSVWRPITSIGLWSVCFINEREGYGANGKRIYRSSDAGRTWQLLTDLSIGDQGPWYPTLFCADAQNLRVQITEPYAALSHVPYLVFATTDAARTWKLEYVEGYTLGTTVGLPAAGLGSYPSLIGVLPDRTTWFITCSPPADTQRFLILTGDGKPLADQSVPFVACARSASFVDAQHGWAIATSYQLKGTDLLSATRLVRTVDGARSWSIVYPR